VGTAAVVETGRESSDKESTSQPQWACESMTSI
jgi:hypothetical protein